MQLNKRKLSVRCRANYSVQVDFVERIIVVKTKVAILMTTYLLVIYFAAKLQTFILANFSCLSIQILKSIKHALALMVVDMQK